MNLLRKIIFVLLSAAAALSSAPFGSVVPVGGHVSDLAIDYRRQAIYLANFAGRRIEVVSLADHSLQGPIPVTYNPCCLALSPNERYLVIGHYATGSLPGMLTILDLDAGQRRSITLPSSPLAAAFGVGEKAFVVTNKALLLVDPVSGEITNLTGDGFTSLTLPTTAPRFPPEILQASTGVSGSGRIIYVLAQGATVDPVTGGTSPPPPAAQAVIYYDSLTRTPEVVSITSTPQLGPRVISTDTGGGRVLAGWSLMNRRSIVLAEFPYATGTLETGSHAIDDELGLVYAQVPRTGGEPPTLSILDLDNLTLRERLHLPENLAGRAVLSRDRQTIYAASDSGLAILPVRRLAESPRVVATQEDVVFRGNFCNRDLISQQIDIVDPGGNRTPFRITGAPNGVRLTASSSTTPATVRIDVDPAAFQNQRGTTEAFLQLESATAVNYPPRIRLLINTQEPEQRGSLINVPGRLVDMLPDPARNRLYVLRQDKNLVLVFEADRFSQIAELRTGNTPVQMAMTQDRRYLIVTADHSQIASVFDLDTLEASTPIEFPSGHYPRSIAVSNAAILVGVRNASMVPPYPAVVDRVQFNSRIATPSPNWDVYLNEIAPTAGLFTSDSGRFVYLLESGGRSMIYDGAVDQLSVARNQSGGLGGGVGTLSDDFLLVGNRLFNRSMVQYAELPADGTAVGYAVLDGMGLRIAGAGGGGVLNRFDLRTLNQISPTRTVESPVGITTPPAPDGQVGQLILPFFRNLTVLPNRNAIVTLSSSGFTVLPTNFDAPTPVPVLESITNLADGGPAVAPGSLISITGQNLSTTSLGARNVPLPTLLAETCIQVNNVFLPLSFVSSGEIRGQLPFSAIGSVRITARTPGGTSQPLEVTVPGGAPAVFRTGRAGPLTGLAAVYRSFNGDLVTESNPIHPNDEVTVYLTGLGRTSPLVGDGFPAPSDPLALSAGTPEVKLGGVSLPVHFSGLVPLEIGVYQINAIVPDTVPEGRDIPLTISLGGVTTEIPVRVLK